MRLLASVKRGQSDGATGWPAARQGVNNKLFDLYEASVIIFLAARFEMVVICNNQNKELGMRNCLAPPR